MNTLQSLVLPNLEVCSEEALYVRLNGRAWAALAEPQLHFRAGGLASSDTFYNGLTLRVWKRVCDIRSLVLALRGDGRFVLTFGQHRRGLASRWLGEYTLVLVAGHDTQVPVPGWDTLQDGLLFFRLHALQPGRLQAAAWRTADPPRHDVRLGLVVTHYDRPAQVQAAIARLHRDLLARPDLQQPLSLTVVDNSRNLADPALPGITVLPNRNLGGTGGFVRGLLALRDSGCHTHALFMDDDASCEAESIARTLALLQYCRDASQAVAGALLRQAAPWQLLEKGARFDGQVRQLAHGLDVRRVDDLLEAEQDGMRPDYGAWWFFAFPLAGVRSFPLPFFVRGDDVHFGLANRFAITTLNGVACFGEDFSTKHSPLTAYLDARYHLVLALLDGRRLAARIGWVATRLFLKPLTAYQYTSARAVALALRHVLQGPRFFREHLDLQAVRSEIAAWQPAERLAPVDLGTLAWRGPRRRPESRLRRLLRLLTLQGFLLPGPLLMDRMVLQDKAFHGRASAVFRYRRVLYAHAADGTGYVAEYDRRRFFAELGAFATLWLALWHRLPRLRQAYLREAPGLASEAFWRGVYAAAPGEAAAAPPAAAPPAAGAVRA
jgi:galactofuranosylgalactofuranosylrhamnosyl-N-acetylglucosaminyl-diphospho-decaprenol beta-1,5/1,6-galactofuranosyltransferase